MTLPSDPRTVDCDVAVIGAGAAGLLAATLCAEARLDVVLAARGASASSLSTGAVDVLGSDEALEVELSEWLAALPPEHPYRRAEATEPGALVGGVEAFRRLAASRGLPYRGRPDRTTRVLGRGGIEGTGLLQAPTALAPLWRPQAVLGIRGATDGPDATVESLRQAAPLAPPKPLDLTIRSDALKDATTPREVARALDAEHVFDRLVKGLKAELRANPAEGVLTPPLFDAQHLHRMKELSEEIAVPVEEVLSPLGAAGARLESALRAAAHAAGVRFLEPARALTWERSGAAMARLHLQTPTAGLRLRANHFVLALGALPAGGFPLPSLVSGFATIRSERSQLAAEGLHPKMEGPPRAALANVWVVGAALGGLPQRKGTGLGPALATAWAAARGIRRAA